MDKNIPSSISIEKFAAYLDGNLMQDEMEIISSEVNNDEMMLDILSASKQVEETIEGFFRLILVFVDPQMILSFQKN